MAQRRSLLPSAIFCLLAGLAATIALAWLPALDLRGSTSREAAAQATLADGPVVAEEPDFLPAMGYVSRRGALAFTILQVTEPFSVRRPSEEARAPTPMGLAPRGLIPVRPPSPPSPSWQDLTPRWARRRAREVLHTPPARSVPARHLTIEARGWPLRAALFECHTRHDPGTGKSVVVRGGWAVRHRLNFALRTDRGYGVTLPLIPIWAGLAADTSLFAAAWALPVFGVPAARRALRRRRGRCQRCAYDLRGLPAGSPCPECGLGVN